MKKVCCVSCPELHRSCILVCSSSKVVNFHSTQQHCVTAVALGCCHFIKSNSHNSRKSRNKQTNKQERFQEKYDNIQMFPMKMYDGNWQQCYVKIYECCNAPIVSNTPTLQHISLFIHFSHDGAYLSPTSVDLHVQLPKFLSKPCSLLSSYCQRISSPLPRLQQGTQISSPLSSALPRLHKAPKNHSPD